MTVELPRAISAVTLRESTVKKQRARMQKESAYNYFSSYIEKEWSNQAQKHFI